MMGGGIGVGAGLWLRQLSASGVVVLMLVLLLLAPRATGAGGGACSTAFVRPPTPAATQQQAPRRCAWVGVTPQRVLKTALWSTTGGQQQQQQQGERQQERRWERSRGQKVALLEAPQRYGSQDWIDNLQSLLGSRIAKRISGHLFFNTGVCAHV